MIRNVSKSYFFLNYKKRKIIHAYPGKLINLIDYVSADLLRDTQSDITEFMSRIKIDLLRITSVIYRKILKY